MKGRCVHATGASLGAPLRGAAFSDQTEFDLDVGAEYEILGLGLFETTLFALVCDNTGKPNWLPVGLFDIPPTALPPGWEFSLIDGVAASGGDASNRWVARWGYTDLVRGDDHVVALIERDPEALRIFFQELKKEQTLG